MASPVEYSPQEIPCFFPGSARFQDSDGQPSGLRGAVATVQISINLKPQWLTGIRVWNVYDVPEALQNVDGIEYLKFLNEMQTMNTELTQSNIIVRDAVQPTIIGRAGVHWHPLPVPYPWSGGDNITLVFRRLTSYPTEVKPTVHVSLEGIMLVSDVKAGRNVG